jgi:NADPH-dependent 2,4-dienoyl-CoA reductase/sulfur reductase-like enzyme
MPGKTTRSSNLELLRILCMLLIIGAGPVGLTLAAALALL